MLMIMIMRITKMITISITMPGLAMMMIDLPLRAAAVGRRRDGLSALSACSSISRTSWLFSELYFLLRVRRRRVFCNLCWTRLLCVFVDCFGFVMICVVVYHSLRLLSVLIACLRFVMEGVCV